MVAQFSQIKIIEAKKKRRAQRVKIKHNFVEVNAHEREGGAHDYRNLEQI
jgi:hypothetical protein